MSVTSFWLTYLKESSVRVSYVNSVDGSWKLITSGPELSWDKNDPSSLTSAIDQSLSQAARDASLPEDQEPSSIALIIPPFWVNSDGKIISAKLKIIESFCKKLSLKPIGFVDSDEAVIENINNKDNFPGSFILLHLESNELILSLVYLGKVKERLYKDLSQPFSPSVVESLLLTLKSDSTLPPQIIIYGKYTQADIESLKDFPWVGKKDIETFVHFPEIISYSQEELINVFVSVVTKELGSPAETNSFSPLPSSSASSSSSLEFEEVSASDLGFSVQSEALPLPQISPEPPPLPPPSPPSKKKVILPKINLNFHLPKIKLPKAKVLLFPLAFMPLLVLIPFFFLTAKVTIFVTPYQFSKKIPIIIDTTINQTKLSPLTIPAEKQTIDISLSSSTKATGKKTIGEKAKGEIVIYNKTDKAQTISKKTILLDSAGHKFELTSDVQIASSSSNLDEGIITLGQTRAIASALDIGPEFNIAKDTKLTFKDQPDTILMAKAKDPFTGGSKSNVLAIASEDKNLLTQKIDGDIDSAAKEKVKNKDGILKETIQIKKNKIEFSREVGEEADELAASVSATVTFFVVNNNQKLDIINNGLSSESEFARVEIVPANFNLAFEITKIEASKASGQITINGNAMPKIDLSLLKQKIAGKTKQKAIEIIKSQVPRTYDLNVNTSFLPFRRENIFIDIGSESL